MTKRSELVIDAPPEPRGPCLTLDALRDWEQQKQTIATGRSPSRAREGEGVGARYISALTGSGYGYSRRNGAGAQESSREGACQSNAPT